MKKKIFVFLFDGFSDWEISYLTPEINKRQNTRMQNNGYSFTSEHRKKISDANKKNAKINDNYGMKNKKHTEKTKNKISKSKLITPHHPTIEHRKKMSVLMKEKIINNKKIYGTSFHPDTHKKLKENNAQTGKPCQTFSGKALKIPHYNKNQGIIIAKSSYEKMYMEYLDLLNINWLYEPKTFIIQDKKSYTPDFLLLDENKFIEIKGFISSQFVEKFNIFKKMYSNINIEILDYYKLKNIIIDFDKKYKTLHTNKYMFDEIKEIEEIDYNDDVYDIQIENCPYFFANNIVSHNSTFDMGVDERIKAMWFFKDKNGKFKKKHYAYITEENKLKVKGIAIVKSNSSELAKLIVKKLTNEIIINCDIKYNKDIIDKMMREEIEKDISIIQTEYKVHSIEDYKSKTCIQMDILNKYGPGTHHLIRNKRVGVGKGVKYCTIEEAKNFSYNDLDLSRIWNELDPFIKTSQATLW